jgi:phage gpG-like protein
MADAFLIVVDDAKAHAWFGRLLERSRDLSGLMDDIGETVTESAQHRFALGIAPDGTPWVPLADGSGRTPLVDSGRMRNDIAPSHGPDWVEISAAARQARWHQEGTAPYTIEPKNKKALAWAGGPGPRKKVHHPGLRARPFIGLSAEDEQAIERLAEAWLDLVPDGG